MQKINNIKLKIGENEDNLLLYAAKIAKTNVKNVKYFKILKKSLDARDKGDIFYTYNVELSLTKETKPLREYPKASGKAVVIGAGPCGLFAALYLARCGVKPVLFERGKSVDERKTVIQNFIKTRELNTECNVQFGEGGAGTFSDGKLTTGVHSERVKWVIEDFVSFGAPKEIEYLSKPHIGSDKLPAVIKNLRNEILRLGGEIYYDAKVTSLITNGGAVGGIVYQKDGKQAEYVCDNVLLCVGHSARDLFESLKKSDIKMEQKPFAVGFRVEHLQSAIGLNQYGKIYDKLPAADYKLVSHAGERDVFSFCMCPGGTVIPAASETGGVVVNGMSEYARDKVNANSAIVVAVTPEDFGSTDPLAGINYQRKLEQKAFALGGKNYSAPVQLVKDFLKNKNSSAFGDVVPSYPLGTSFCPLHEFFDSVLTRSLSAGVTDMERKIKGFAFSDAVFTGVESRTSSPLRILRNEDMESVNLSGLYPAGEGAGYAGGITSAAADGIKAALALAQKLQAK